MTKLRRARHGWRHRHLPLRLQRKGLALLHINLSRAKRPGTLLHAVGLQRHRRTTILLLRKVDPATHALHTQTPRHSKPT